MIKDFTDLLVWQKAHQLVLLVYKTTKSFPDTERYALADQIKRASVSVSSNIAEGFARQSNKEKVQFYFMASASLIEVRNQLIIARDLGYILSNSYNELFNVSIEVNKMIYGLIKVVKSKY